MLVKLPRACSGKEIVEAFLSVATFEEDEATKWTGNAFIGEYHFDVAPPHPTARSMGVQAAPERRRKKWLLFGDDVWSRDTDKTFILRPLILANEYHEVDVTVRYVYEHGQDYDYTANDPSKPRFEDIRPLLERILTALQARLSPPS